MNINKLYTFVASMAVAFTITSCEDAFGDFLNKEPSNELTEEQVFSDWSLLRQFHWDTYAFLREGPLRIGNSWLDAATDLAETSYGTGGTRTSFNIGNYYASSASDELTGTWESRYRAIRKCNMLLERIDKVPKLSTLSQEEYETEKATFKAEARFFRAYFYWEMFLRYGPVPIVKEVLDPDGDLLSGYTTRPSINEFINFILTELNECQSNLLTYEASTVASEYGRVNQPIAAALKSRILLYMASPRFASESGITWTQARDAAKSFIETYGNYYSLVTENNQGLGAYNNAWYFTPYQDKNKETIFFRNKLAISWGDISSDTPVGEGGSGGLCPSQNLVDMYDMADGSAPFANYDATGAPVYSGGKPSINLGSGYSDANMWADRDPRLAATVLYHGVSWGNGVINVIQGQRDNPLGNQNATPTGYYLRKYIPATILLNEHAGTARRLWKIIGYAEILLNYAEAENEVNGPSETVYGLLDQIRHRGGIYGNVADRQTWTKETMRNFIHKERTVELVFEEHRWWDVRRWGVAVEALSRPIYGVNVASDGSITRKVAQNRVFEEKMYLYPIPETEVWKTSIENNKGW